MGALALFTLAVVTATGVARGDAIRRGVVTEDFYRLFEGGDRPSLEAQLSRHYGNLLELPACITWRGSRSSPLTSSTQRS